MKKNQIISLLTVMMLFSGIAVNAEIKNDGILLVKNTKEKSIPPGHAKYPPGLSKTPPGLNKVPPGIEKRETQSFWGKVARTILFWKD